MSYLLETLVFQHWRPPRVGRAKPTMARKRAASARTPVEPMMRGRPRRSTRNIYASALEDQVVEEPAVKDQPPIGKDLLASDPTPEQVLQQCKPNYRAHNKKEIGWLQPSLPTRGQPRHHCRQQKSENSWPSCKRRYKACSKASPNLTHPTSSTQQIKASLTLRQVWPPNQPSAHFSTHRQLKEP